MSIFEWASQRLPYITRPPRRFAARAAASPGIDLLNLRRSLTDTIEGWRRVEKRRAKNVIVVDPDGAPNALPICQIYAFALRSEMTKALCRIWNTTSDMRHWWLRLTS